MTFLKAQPCRREARPPTLLSTKELSKQARTFRRCKPAECNWVTLTLTRAAPRARRHRQIAYKSADLRMSTGGEEIVVKFSNYTSHVSIQIFEAFDYASGLMARGVCVKRRECLDFLR